MKAWLMHSERDIEPKRDPVRHEWEVIQDLALETLLDAMADDDAFLRDVGLAALLSGFGNDLETILYRQDVMEDCLANAAVVRELHGLAVQAVDPRRRPYLGFSSRYPGGVLHGAVDTLDMLMGMLRMLRRITDRHGGRFRSRGFRTLFATLQKELSDEYLAGVQQHLTNLRFKDGIGLNARLEQGHQGASYELRVAPKVGRGWLKRLLGGAHGGYTFHIHERDEAGARYLSELRDRGINRVANAAAQAAEHLLSFFGVLRTELAFYVCCLNLSDRLAAVGAPIARPRSEAVGSRRFCFRGLYDVCLALSLGENPVGNSLDADGKNLVVITGANQGGKSSFLRSIGLAQLMMQCGMFVGAETFAAETCAGLFTHHKREEDPSMKRGKLDEELNRMSEIADAIVPNAMLLCNESFAATNEREGSEIARQVVTALLEKHVKIFFVTHLYEFAHGVYMRQPDQALFLRAQRRPDGTRTFKLTSGEPLDTSYGEDLYAEIFAAVESLEAPAPARGSTQGQ